MKVNNSIKITGIIVIAVLVVVVFGFYSVNNIINPGQRVSSSGFSEVFVMPDRVGLYFSVTTNGFSSSEASDANSKIVDDLVVALIREGFDRDEIETQNFNVREQYDWTGDGREFIGYQAVHSIRLRVPSEEKALIGSAIDAGVDAGASLSYINYELSQESQNKYKAEALKLATEDARIKAGAMAEGLGMEISKLVSISDSSFDYRPVFGMDYAESAKSGEAIATDIQPSEQTVSARVSVIYKLK